MTKKKHTFLLGAHMSIAGGFSKALERGASIGCTTIQIFTKSNRQWHAKEITKQEATAFKEAQKTSNIKPIIVHASYLINLASPQEETQEKSVKALEIELERCHQLEIPYLVLHPGSSLSGTPKEGLDLIIKHLNTVLSKTTNETIILLETMAGQGSGLCSTFEQLAYVYKNIHAKKRLGICLDTCHIFAAGYDISTHAAYEKVIKEFDDILGLELLKAMHINDSKQVLGSKVDRHAPIGKGKMGLKSFELLFNDPRFFDIPKILETPEGTLEDYARDMETIHGLLSEKTKTILGIVEEEKEK